MAKGLDVEKVQKALKQAGSTAVRGSKEARAGKFLYRDASSGRVVDRGDRGAQSSASNKKPK